MNVKRIMRYWLPILPFAFLAFALLGAAIALETQTQNNAEIPTAVNAQLTGTVTPQSTPPLQPSVVPQESKSEHQQLLNIFKDVSLVVAAGIISLVSAYIGGVVQGAMKEEEQKRDNKAAEVREYATFLKELWKMAQRYEKIITDPKLREILPSKGRKYEITSERLDTIISSMPLYGRFSIFDTTSVGVAYNKAVNACIQYIINLQHGIISDKNNVMEEYREAMREMDEYIHS